jgi:zinc protease
LVIIVREDHSAPVVAAQVWCKAGSIDEGRWLGAGLSHVLEHMLFKGTTTRETGRIDQEVQAAGGYLNAYTSFDRTVYWINVPNTGARVALDILGDVSQHASLPPEELAKEMDVIRREMDLGNDDPHRRSSRRLFETAYVSSPYRYPTIGYPDIFNQLTRADVLAYYLEKYAPNNLFFVVVGDIDQGAVVTQITQAFAATPARPVPPTPWQDEPRQVAPRELVEEASVELAHFHFAWHTPDIRHGDVPALDVLAAVLGAGHSSRLFQEVREKQGLVSSIGAWLYSPGNPGLLGISAVAEGHRFGPACAAVMAEVERVKQTLVPQAELAKVIRQFVAATLCTRKTMEGQALDLGGNWMAAADLNFSERYLAAARRVTPDELQRVARQYLAPENGTLYALAPPKTAARQVITVAPRREKPIRKVEVPNGLRLLLKEDHRLPFVEFRLVLGGGVLAETAATNGRTHLLARMLMQGTTRHTAEQLVAEIESVGGHIDTYSGNNSLGVSAEVLKDDFALGLALVGDVLLRPLFLKDALERERQMQLAALKAQRDQLLSVASRRMRQAMFGEVAYGLDPLGSESSVTALGLEDLRATHQALVVPGNAVLAIYGDLDPDSAVKAVTEVFVEWRQSGKESPFPSKCPPRAAAAAQRVVETRDKKQAVLVVGFPGSTMRADDRFALELLQEACSDLGSRLFLRIRDRLGLAYYVGAQNLLGLIPGWFAFYAGTAPDEVELVEKELFSEAAALRSEGLTEEELRRAKAKLIGQKKIARQDLGGLAQANALDELFGLGYANFELEDARFEAVTREETTTVAQRYLRPEASVVALIKPQET